MLTERQIERYSRQIILPEIGGRGQERLLSSAAAVVGAGDTARIAAIYLAAAGVGTLGIDGELADFDGGNPDCCVCRLDGMRTTGAATEIVRVHDVVIVAGTQGLAEINAACVALGKPLVWGDSAGSVARAAVLIGTHANAPCYCCLPQISETSPLAALAAPAAGFIGALLATEALKLLLGREAMRGGIVYDALDGTVRAEPVTRDPQCPICTPQDSAAAGRGL
jgi:molybdopterin-synthase adenylyltransferase